jgi:hypothetical protein
MNFIRGIDPKIALNLGIFKKIPLMMENSEYDYQDFREVWQWALKKHKFSLFSYLVSFHGKNWINGELIDLANYNNDLLWLSIEAKNIAAVKSLLNYPNLFPKEIFTLEQGTSELEGEFVERGDTKTPARATNFGTHLNLAIQHYPNSEIEEMLRSYYSKYSKK